MMPSTYNVITTRSAINMATATYKCDIHYYCYTATYIIITTTSAINI